jgi:acetoin utilization deacetylase AcuC-like enzyme
MSKLEEHGLEGAVREPKKEADKRLIETIHERTYIDMLESYGEGYLDPDTYNRDETYGIAALAVKGAVMAAEYSYAEEKPSFGLVRPPGHHAGRDYAGGFCYFNNIALAAQYLRDKHGLERVAVIDYDVHHGNGTEDIFFKRKDVLYVSTHQWGIYPGTGNFEHVGDEEGEGFTLNIPFPHASGDSSFELAFKELIKPIVSQYKPQMILISLGSDAHYKDPIASLSLSSRGYLWLAEQSIKMAGELCSGRISFMLEGGYHLEALAEVTAGIVGLCQDKPKKVPMQYNVISDKDRIGFDAIDNIKQIQADYWKL